MVRVHSQSLMTFEAGDSSAWCVEYLDCTVERTVNEAPEHRLESWFILGSIYPCISIDKENSKEL